MTVESTRDADKDSRISRLILRGTASGIAAQTFEMGMGFILTPFVLYHLGPTTFGIWALVGSVVAYGTLLDIGITPALTKYVAEFRARQQPEEARRIVATALTIYWCMGLFAIALAVALAPFFTTLFNIPASERQTAMWLVVLAGIGVGLALPCSTAYSVLRGMHRYDLTNAITIVGVLLSALATVGVLLMDFGVLGIVVGNIGVMIVMQMLGIWFIRRLMPELHFGRLGASRKSAWAILTFSSSVSLQQVSSRLQTKTDQIVIGAYLPVVSVTPYALALRLGTVTFALTRQFMKMLLPLASELDAERDSARLRSLYVTSTRLGMAIFLPIGCAMVLLAGPILTVWVGPQYAAFAHLVAILTLAGFLESITWPAGMVLQGMARHRLLAVTSSCAAIANLGLSIILVQRIGLTGVALGTLIPTGIGLCVILPYIMRVIGIDLALALRGMFMPALLPGVPSVLTLLVLRDIIDPSSLISIGFVAASGVAVYALGYLVIGASDFEKRMYKGYAASVARLLGMPFRRVHHDVDRGA